MQREEAFDTPSWLFTSFAEWDVRLLQLGYLDVDNVLGLSKSRD